MGISSDAILAYGIMFDDGHAFPWDTDEHDYSIDDWWLNMNFEEGNKPVDFGDRYKWLKENPPPFEVSNYCSCDYPMYMLNVPGSKTQVNRGYPKEIDVNDILSWTSNNKEAIEKYMLALQKYEIIEHPKPKWHLYSYMG